MIDGVDGRCAASGSTSSGGSAASAGTAERRAAQSGWPLAFVACSAARNISTGATSPGTAPSVGRDDEPTPARPRQLGGDPPRTKTGMRERERDDPLLHDRRELVGHPRPAPLARTQHLQPVPVDLPLPGVVGRAMNTESTTRLRDTHPSREIEQLQPVAEEHVILRHATHLLSPLGREEASLSRKADSARPRPGAVTLKLLLRPQLSGELGDSPP